MDSTEFNTGFVHLWPVKIPWFSMTFSMTFWKTLWPKLSNSSPAVVSKQSFIQLRLNLIFGPASWFFNFGSLSFIESILIFHDFPWPTPTFQDFPGLEIEILKFHDFPGFPWPVRTLPRFAAAAGIFLEICWFIFCGWVVVLQDSNEKQKTNTNKNKQTNAARSAFKTS